MPMRRKNYPVNWDAISHRIRFERARGRCECEGECGEDHHHTTYRSHGHEEPREVDEKRCLATHGKRHPVTLSIVVLTVAHRDHDAASGDHSDRNLVAMCQRCHLAYDRTEGRPCS
jgi:hypothetical protein